MNYQGKGSCLNTSAVPAALLLAIGISHSAFAQSLNSQSIVGVANDGTYMNDGEFVVLFESGEQNEKGAYKDGKPDGRIQEWDIKGVVVTDGIWVNGKPQSGLCRDQTDGKKIKQYKDGVAAPATSIPDGDKK